MVTALAITMTVCMADPAHLYQQDRLETVRLETSALLKRTGASVTWDCASLQKADAVVIMTEKPGRRDALAETPKTRQGGVMPIWIHVATVWDAIPMRSQQDAAVARLIVHELVHAVDPSAQHAFGLFSARLDAELLTRPLSDGDLEAIASAWRKIRQRLAH